MINITGAVVEMVEQPARGRPRTVSGDVLDKDILELVRKGFRPREIAIALNVDASFVSPRLWFLRRQGHDIPIFRAGRAPESRLNAVSQGDLVSEITSLRKKGWSFEEIAVELNVSDHTARRLYDNFMDRRSGFKRAVMAAAQINYAQGGDGEMPHQLRWGQFQPTKTQLQAVSALHLIDLKRAGHSPVATEYTIEPEGNSMRVDRGRATLSYCSSPQGW